MTENKPIAWVYESRIPGCAAEEVVSVFKPEIGHPYCASEPEPLYRHPPAPQPDADPAVEAARRKALRAIFAALDEYPWACDTCRETGVPFGVLRDLVGQPRQYPERAISGYDRDEGAE